MRITNKMMSGNSLANINTNKEYLDKLNNQMATEKKITRPSDDPIVAIRALRLRSNLSEITQYYGANVPDAQAWVNVTQSAIMSTKEMLSSLKSYANQGANGTNTASDRKQIYENMQAMQKQIYSNGNATNAGRSVFTGYRTSEALTFAEDTTADYRGIWDSFNASDITRNTYVEGAPSLDEINKVSPTGDETTVKEDKVNRIRLSYENINGTIHYGPTAGWSGEMGTISGWDGSTQLSDYYNEDGTLNNLGLSKAFNITKGGSDVGDDDGPASFILHDPYDQSLSVTKEYFSYSNLATATIESQTADEIKIKYTTNGDNTLNLTLTVKKDSSGNYSADKGATVEKSSDGSKLTITIPGANGSMDCHTEITADVDSGGSLSNPEAVYKEKAGETIFWPEKSTYGGDSIAGKVYYSGVSDSTTLVYRTELTGTAAIDLKSVTSDPVDGLQSFDLECGSRKLTIKKYPDEGRWFAGTVDASGNFTPDKTVGVTRNADNSFTIMASTTPQVEYNYERSNCDVFNVSANGRSVTSYYHQHALGVKITDSSSTVAVDSTGKELTAYQYLALNPNNENTDDDAANSIYLLADTGELVFGSNIEKTLSGLKDIPGVDTISVMYDKSSYEAGELRPEHYFDVKQYDEKHNMAKPIVYDNHNQDINYTVGTNQSIKINTNAEDVFDTQIIREIDDVLAAIDEYNLEEEKVNKLKAMQEDTGSYDETQRQQIQKMLDAANKGLDIAKNKLQRTYEEAITQFGKFFDQANLADTACGTVDNRLTLVSNRLSEEKTTVTTLASENENVDITNIAVEVSEANLVYNAALMATGRISQQTLVDYI